MMKRQDIFVTPIWVFENLPIDNSKLEEHVQRLRNKDPESRNPENYQDILTVKWKSYNLNSKDFLATPELNKLISIVNDNVNECFLELNARETSKLELSDAWYNIYDVGSSLEGHTHPGNCLSATYYIKYPPNSGYFTCATGDRTNVYQYNAKYFTDRNELTREKFLYEPVVGTLIVFPSNLYHFVTPNRSDDQRISMAFNHKLITDNKFTPNHRLFKQ